MNRYHPILIRVVLPKSRRQCVQNYAALNEIVEENRSISVSIKLPDQRIVNSIREAIPESRQSLFQLIFVDISRTVRVERAETILPIGDILPECPKVLKTDAAPILPVKHPYH